MSLTASSDCEMGARMMGGGESWIVWEKRLGREGNARESRDGCLSNGRERGYRHTFEQLDVVFNDAELISGLSEAQRFTVFPGIFLQSFESSPRLGWITVYHRQRSNTNNSCSSCRTNDVEDS